MNLQQNSLEELQQDVDLWLEQYNNHRTHSGKYCYGKTPMHSFLESQGSISPTSISDSHCLSDSHL